MEQDLNSLKNNKNSSNKVIIRKMTEDDINAVTKILAKVFSPEYISYGELTVGRAIAPGIPCDNIEEVFRQELLNNINNDKVEFFVASWTEEIVGFALASINSTPIGHQECWLDDLVVDSNFRHRGIGEKLVKTVIDWGQRNNAKYFLLESGINKQKAHDFFEKLGFQAITKIFWHSGADKNS